MGYKKPTTSASPTMTFSSSTLKYFWACLADLKATELVDAEREFAFSTISGSSHKW